MINVGVIGATGSVGSSVMAVCAAWPDKISVKALAANKRSEKLAGLAEKFKVAKSTLMKKLETMDLKLLLLTLRLSM